MITAAQMRAARALLGIDQRQLAELSGVSLPTIGSTVIVLHSGMMIVSRCGTQRKAIAFDTVVVQLTFARRHEIVWEGRDPRPNI